MLRKLMKYEFMAMGRIFLPLYGTLIIISLVNLILGLVGLSTPMTISMVVSIMLMVGILVITFILVIQRFWSNLLSGEGYLMMTLPVSTDRIILSKLFTAAILNVASLFVTVLAILIMSAPTMNLDFESFRLAIKSIYEIFADAGVTQILQIAVALVEGLVIITLGLFSQILLLYSCMALSMISNKYRWLVAIGAYLVITTALQIIGSVIAAIGVYTGIFETISNFFRNFASYSQFQAVILVVMFGVAILCTAFYFITRYMLSKRLNLQ